MDLQIVSNILALLGTVLIFFYGITPAINPEGHSRLLLNGPEDITEKNKYKKYKLLSQSGLALLILSFVLQLFNEIKFDENVFKDILSTFQLLATILIGYFAYKITYQQTEINRKMLEIHDYVEIFVMPRMINNGVGEPISKKVAQYELLIKNASYYPIYLQKYNLNGEEKNIGSCVIPNGGDHWYGVIVSSEISNLELDLYYEDYMGKRYKTKVKGSKSDNGWHIWNNKKELIK